MERSERITYDDVENICTFLDKQKIEITILKVHSILGKGSNTTISKYIEKWKNEEKNKSFKINPKIIRFLEAEIENESYKLTNSVNQKLNEVEKQNNELIDNIRKIRYYVANAQDFNSIFR